MKIPVAKYRGDVGEAFAIALYQRAGFHLIKADLRIKYAQIDFIASRNFCFHFVEVKYRKSITSAYEALRPEQINRIGIAAVDFMQDFPGKNWQIDALLIDQNFNFERIDNIQMTMH